MQIMKTKMDVVLMPLVVVTFTLSLALAQARVVQEDLDDGSDSDSGMDLLDIDDGWPVLCPDNNWYSKQKESCLPCTECSEGFEATRPCFRFQDTRCAPVDSFPRNIINLPLSGRRRHRENPADEDAAKYRPVVIALGIVTGVLFIALVVASVSFVVWRRKVASSQTRPNTPEKKLDSVYIYSSFPTTDLLAEKTHEPTYSLFPSADV